MTETVLVGAGCEISETFLLGDKQQVYSIKTLCFLGTLKKDDFSSTINEGVFCNNVYHAIYFLLNTKIPLSVAYTSYFTKVMLQCMPPVA